MNSKDREYWIQKAIEQAKLNETPFGAIIVDPEGRHVGAYNTTSKDGPAAHAEINVIQLMSQLDVEDPRALTLYSTVEPCPMCMSAIVWAGIGQVVFGASIDDAANFGKQLHISSKQIAELAWYPIQVEGGVLKDECKRLFT
ncbi:nucleoside deaminase [Psychroflexus tropicus]|uniref:nucleoside deaminase n=1 Tax=Psychroflexus tropicus TaxID=197345 RepID=UPI00036B37C5|nr:nucleoside deaminase [Psychroflexus tropicus]